MPKSGMVARIFMFITFTPIIFFLIFFDFPYYPLLNLALALSVGIAACEMNNLLRASYNLFISPYLAFVLGLYPLAINYALMLLRLERYVAEILIISFILLVFIFSLFLLNNKESSVENLLSYTVVSGILFLYPGLIFMYISKITLIANTSVYTGLLASVVFLNDTLAYVFGILLGKWIPGSLLVSPNKTIIGFVGGILGSILTMVLAWYFSIFQLDLYFVIFLGALLGFCVILGDLLESSFKRRAGIKDSGKLIKGRGGILDSCDSFFFLTPVLYYILVFFI